VTQILRQSTQIIVRIGPFVDVGDGFTPETGVTLSGADEAELLKANTATTTDIAGATWAAITGCDGWYALTLTTSLTDTVGPLDIMVQDDSVCLPVFARFQVIEEAAYDAMYAASAAPATAAGVSAVETDTQDIQSRLPAALVNSRMDSTIDGTGMEAGAAAVVSAAVWDEDATGHQTGGTFGQAIGDPGANTETIYDAVVTDAAGTNVAADIVAVKAETAAILDDTDLIDDGTSGLAKIATDVAAILVDTGTTLQAELDGIQADTEDIQTRLPAALVGGRIDATVDATGMEAGAVAAIADGVWTEDITDHEGVADSTAEALANAGAAGTPPTVEEIRTEMDDNSTKLAAIVADTNELQADWVNGGRLDLILDARASQTSVDDLPTNAELATALGTADDAVLAQVALVKTETDKIASVKSKTDSLNFGVTGKVDANVTHVNEVEVAGGGTEGDEWGPAP
jgi:hypothetical protein